MVLFLGLKMTNSLFGPIQFGGFITMGYFNFGDLRNSHKWFIGNELMCLIILVIHSLCFEESLCICRIFVYERVDENIGKYVSLFCKQTWCGWGLLKLCLLESFFFFTFVTFTIYT
jgi:hypothetical protein